MAMAEIDTASSRREPIRPAQQGTDRIRMPRRLLAVVGDPSQMGDIGPERPGGAGPSRRSTGAANGKGLREHPNHHQAHLRAASAPRGPARGAGAVTQIGKAMIRQR
jgi:hypothetical protein